MQYMTRYREVIAYKMHDDVNI